MNNLEKLVNESFESEKKERSGFVGVNGRLIEVLKLNEKMSRIEVRKKIVVLRLIEMGVKGDEKDFNDILKGVKKTIYNGLNSSIANSNNVSSFNFNFGEDNGVYLERLGDKIWLRNFKDSDKK